MLLKTVHQWDICNQEDLDTFRQESEAIHNSASRTLYCSDPYADPGQHRDEELANRYIDYNKRTKSKRRVNPTEDDLISNRYPSREEFLARLTSDLEHRKNGEYDGYSIVVKAVMEHRGGETVRTEFVETEGPRLAHLPDPNLGRILEKLLFDERKGLYVKIKELYMTEGPNGSIGISEINESPCALESETVELLHQQYPNKKDIRLMQSLLIEDNDKYRAREYEEVLEKIYLEGQRERLSKQLQDQAAKP